MVLGSQGPGRVGRRRFNLGRPRGRPSLFLGAFALLSYTAALMSTLAIVLIALGVVVVVFFIGGLLTLRARGRREAATFDEHVRAADLALEQARALDKGWHRDTMESAARDAVAQARPGWSYDDLHLVLVDDRPGTEEDRAQFVAMAPDDQVRVILARDGDSWVLAEVAD